MSDCKEKSFLTILDKPEKSDLWIFFFNYVQSFTQNEIVVPAQSQHMQL